MPTTSRFSTPRVHAAGTYAVALRPRPRARDRGHRTTRQITRQRRTRAHGTGVPCVERHKRICADMAPLEATFWRVVLCSSLECGLRPEHMSSSNGATRLSERRSVVRWCRNLSLGCVVQWQAATGSQPPGLETGRGDATALRLDVASAGGLWRARLTSSSWPLPGRPCLWPASIGCP
jgi:hypothetical protein